MAPRGACGSQAPARGRAGRRPVVPASRVGREPPGDRRRDRPGPGAGGREHRGHGALPGRGYAYRLRVAVGRGSGGGRARRADRPRPRLHGLHGREQRVSGRFDSSGALRGKLRPPPDKSISHRAALLGAMADGETAISRFLRSEDTAATLRAATALGAAIDEERRSDEAVDVRMRGIGLRGPGEGAPGEETRIDVGNAGTLLRLLPGWLAGQGGGSWMLDGDESIRRRPVDRVAEPLSAMGAAVSCRDGRLPPLRVEGASLAGIEYRLPVASAQVKSCVLLAGLLAEGETTVVERDPTRDHTERMLAAAGAQITVSDAGTPVTIHGALPAKRITVGPADRLEPGEITI